MRKVDNHRCITNISKKSMLANNRWLSAQKAIRAAKAEAEQDAGQYTTPQRTWWEEQALAD